ncbi:MAG: phage tail protein [Chloroflexi bacterium]|nr:MAG: phage tail protein [Anaerolineae bacterium]MBL1137458.1 phage tail protein [Chloroflexota bacterium]MBZ0320183.1 phage tail protein [Anaerolineae bacterium]MCQ3932258.1 phage tail protein [Chloroflexota bacterium]NOG65565.1 phage tail protein [Chloroflexota bacterium]
MSEEAFSAHSFVIEINGSPMAAFTECTLPTLEIETQDQKEGGLNEYTHVLPVRRKSGRLILKRGLTASQELLSLYKDLLSGQVQPATYSVSVVMYDSMKSELARWNFDKAIPVKWTGPTLKSDTGAVAIESLELVVHDYIP